MKYVASAIRLITHPRMATAIRLIVCIPGIALVVLGAILFFNIGHEQAKSLLPEWCWTENHMTYTTLGIVILFVTASTDRQNWTKVHDVWDLILWSLFIASVGILIWVPLDSPWTAIIIAILIALAKISIGVWSILSTGSR